MEWEAELEPASLRSCVAQSSRLQELLSPTGDPVLDAQPFGQVGARRSSGDDLAPRLPVLGHVEEDLLVKQLARDPLDGLDDDRRTSILGELNEAEQELRESHEASRQQAVAHLAAVDTVLLDDPAGKGLGLLDYDRMIGVTKVHQPTEQVGRQAVPAALLSPVTMLQHEVDRLRNPWVVPVGEKLPKEDQLPVEAVVLPIGVLVVEG